MPALYPQQNQDQEEENRVKALQSYCVLENLHEEDFDNIVKLTASIFQVPIAVISLIDKETLWLKAKVGLDFEKLDREQTFCHYTILHKEYLEVNDIFLFEPFKEHPLTKAEKGIRFYASVPLINAEGYCLGTICMFDYKPRQLSPEQQYSFKTLARQVMVNMELQRRERQLQAEKDKISAYVQVLEKNIQEMDLFSYAISHDLKAPVKAIHNLAEWVAEDLTEAPASVHTNLELLQARAKRLERLMEALGNYARAGRSNTGKELVDVKELVTSIIHNLDASENTTVELLLDLPLIHTNKQQIHLIFHHLIKNAIQHNSASPLHLQISGRKEKDGDFTFHVKDNGTGMSASDQLKIFGLFKTIKARDEEDNTGVGLAIVKKILTQRGSDITVSSELDKGSTFSFSWSE